MPLVTPSTFSSPKIISNPHLQTVLGVMSHRPALPAYERQHVTTSDGEVLCLDWLRANNRSVAIVCHGLEGSSTSSYMRSMCSSLYSAGWDVVACNMRGSGGERSRTPTFSHGGSSDDLRTVINSLSQSYQEIALVGFSLGGNIILKYLGEEGSAVPGRLLAACVFSVPCDLASTADKLARPRLYPYMVQFLWYLKKRIDRLSRGFPEVVKPFSLNEVKTFRQFDQIYTAPLHGFRDVIHYWNSSSAVAYLKGIATPTLIVNASDDPFLDTPSFPIDLVSRLPNVYLEIPKAGGHLGFLDAALQPRGWVNDRTMEFFNNVRGKRQ